jgi:stage V sporulation protein R
MACSAAYPTDGELWELARGLGLDPYPVHFESVPAPVLYEYAAYLIPGRMSHWTYGRAYHLMKMRYDYGLNKLYEMVINADPAYAFLLDANSALENTFVRAHVMGHVDFFRHNVCFSHTPKDMIEIVSRHAERVRQYAYQYGQLEVERLLDAVLSLQEHVGWETPAAATSLAMPHRARSAVRAAYQELLPDITSAPARHDGIRRGDDDLLLFLVQHSPELRDWQRDIMSMVRAEMLYFWPQIRTKIMNEGWATFWHEQMMRRLALSDRDFVDFARLHSQVLAPVAHHVNPYALGYAIFRDIDRRYGRSTMFMVREMDDDVSFVRNYLTESVVEHLHLFVYGPDKDRMVVKSHTFEEVRQQLVRELLHGGIPVIEVADGDFHRRGELYLVHRHEGVDLDVPYAERALHYVHQLWGRPVHLQTVVQQKPVVLTFDGRSNSQVTL